MMERWKEIGELRKQLEPVLLTKQEFCEIMEN